MTTYTFSIIVNGSFPENININANTQLEAEIKLEEKYKGKDLVYDFLYSID